MLASFAPMPLQADKDACKDGPELFAFMHQHKLEVWWDIALRQHPSPDAEPGYNVFGDALEQWGEIVRSWGTARSDARRRHSSAAFPHASRRRCTRRCCVSTSSPWPASTAPQTGQLSTRLHSQ